MYDHIREHEAQFRLFLRNALLRSVNPDSTDEPLRRAGRLDLLDAALEPLDANSTPKRSSGSRPLTRS